MQFTNKTRFLDVIVAIIGVSYVLGGDRRALNIKNEQSIINISNVRYMAL